VTGIIQIDEIKNTVMAGLVPATQDLLAAWVIMGGRHKGGHDDFEMSEPRPVTWVPFPHIALTRGVRRG
jgi:hypothetical protein